MIEVEIRGHLDSPKKAEFEQYLKQHADKKSEYYDVAIFFATDDLPGWGDFYNSQARLSANHRVYADGAVKQRIKYKDGHAAAHGRQEYEILLADESLENFIALIKKFGVTRGSFRGCERIDYILGDIEVALKYNHPCGDHFEVELAAHTEADVPKVKQQLETFIKPFEFHIWSPDEYKQVIRESVPRAPQVDLDEGVKKYIKKRP